MDLILNKIRRALISETAHFPVDPFIIRGVWEFGMCCQPWGDERIFRESGCLVAAYGLGTSFRTCNDFTPIDRTVLNNDGRLIESCDKAFQIAILDACYSAIKVRAHKEYSIETDTVTKSRFRAKIVTSEVKRIANKIRKQHPLVLMIGYVKAIAQDLETQNIGVLVSELDETLIGTVRGVNSYIADGANNCDLIKQCDIVVATGLTITTSTIDGILETCKEYSKPAVIFAQTGSHLAHKYRDFGATTVIAEHFPWYSMPGKSNIKVYRSIHTGNKCTTKL